MENPKKERERYAAKAFELLLRCREEAGSPVTISPLSAYTAMALVCGGTSGQTRREIEDALGGMDCAELDGFLSRLYAELTTSRGAELSCANAVWASPHFALKESFVSRASDRYGAAAQQIDFRDADAAAETVNRWCGEKTRGRIGGIVEAKDFTEDTMLLLTNALCFDAKWLLPYSDELQVKPGVFHGASGDREATMLSREETTDYLEGEAETGFCKYYRGGRYAFAALLPKKEGNLAEYLAGLTGERFLSLTDGAERQTVYSRMPAFRQETGTDLKNVLRAMGIREAFTEEADFSPMGTCENGLPLRIGKVLHKTFFEVGNEGTRAAAATAVEMMCTTSLMPYPAQPKRVILDRPFVFAVIETGTKLPLFVGTME